MLRSEPRCPRNPASTCGKRPHGCPSRFDRRTFERSRQSAPWARCRQLSHPLDGEDAHSRGHTRCLLPPEAPLFGSCVHARASASARGRFPAPPECRATGVSARWPVCVAQGAAVACVRARETRAGTKSARALVPCASSARVSCAHRSLSFAAPSRDHHPLILASHLQPTRRGQMHPRAAQ